MSAPAARRPAVDRSTVVKAIDGVFATYVAGPVAYRIVCRAVDAPVTPNQVTVVSFVLMIVAALAASRGTFAGNLVAVILAQTSFVLDMVDGQLARARGSGSAFGAFLDEITDRTGEVVLYAGAAVGAAAARPETWPLAYATAALVLLRHVGDLALAVRFRLDSERERELLENGWLTQSLRAAGLDESRRGPLEIVKTLLWFSIGDRLALFSAALLVLRPDLYFWVAIFVGGPSYLGRLVQKVWRLR